MDHCVPGSEMLFPWTRCGVASWAVDCATLSPDTFPILCSLPFPLYPPKPLATANMFARPSIPAPLAPVLNDTIVHLMTLRFGDLQWKVHTAAFLYACCGGGNGKYHGTRVPLPAWNSSWWWRTVKRSTQGCGPARMVPHATGTIR